MSKFINTIEFPIFYKFFVGLFITESNMINYDKSPYLDYLNTKNPHWTDKVLILATCCSKGIIYGSCATFMTPIILSQYVFNSERLKNHFIPLSIFYYRKL